jgi:glucose/arabinose dehydrogenase
VRRRTARLAALLAFGALALPSLASAEPALPPGFQDEVVFDGIEQPTNFRFAPDGRIFVATKPGEILVYKDLGDSEPTVFADLRGDVYDNGDRGLLGLALDPKFDQGRPYVYALYTWDHVLGEAWNPADPKYGTPGVSGDPGCPSQNSSASCLVSGRLVRLEENLLDPDHAVEEGGRAKERELLQGWCQQFSSHSIGDLQFGPEEALYVSGGDGAAYESIPDWGQLGTPPNPCGDPNQPAGTAPSPRSESQGGALRAQNLKLLNGAILRIDPDTGDPFPGNPLAGNGNANAERTVAKGFRNPFRFVLNQATDEIYSGNVGSSEIEEIDRFRAPPATLYNSGWPCFEGIERQFQFRELGLNVCTAMYAGEPDSFSPPLFSYSHNQTVVPDDECPTESGSAVSGLSFYEGNQFPSKYRGALFFADAVRGCLWVMYPGEDGRPDASKVERFMREGKVYPGVKIVEGPDGYLYYADLFSKEGAGDGEIHRIAYRPGSPTARLEAKPPYGLYDAGDKFETTIDAASSSDLEGDPLTYKWDLNEDGVFESSGGQTRTRTFTKAEQEAREKAGESPNRVIAVRVEDDEGFASVAKVTVYPGDKPPVPTITKPEAGFEWGVGDEIKLDGKGIDAKGAEINTPLPYYWVTRMAHCPDAANPTACHVHPLQTFAGIRRPEFVAPQHDYPSYIEVVLRVSDMRGLSGTTTIKVDPRTVAVSAASEPAGIPLLVGSTEAAAPFSVPQIDGSEILVSAPATQRLGGAKYKFEEWSDGGAISHPIVVEEGAPEYRATYSEVKAVEVKIASDPAGIELQAGSEEGPTPFAAVAFEDEEIQLAAPLTYELGGKRYVWQRWSDGGAISHPIPLEGAAPEYKAFYAEAPPKGSGAGSGSGGAAKPPPPGGKEVATPPRTKLGRHPPARSRKTTATFAFSADLGSATFRCKLDGKRAQPCRSPKTYRKLKPGKHIFKVWAVAGVLSDRTPAKFSWKILPPKR